jgi:heat induced stress protein YflT
MTTKTITGLYDTYDDAAQTVRDLAAAGIPDADVSLVANNVDDQHAIEEASNAAPDAGRGAVVGSVLGGGAGLLAGLGLLAIPGVGPVVAGGWLVTTAVGAIAGAGAGAATGGVVGSLTSAGVTQEHADVYAEGVRRGGTLVTARVDEDRAAAVEEIMGRHRSVDPDTRGRVYRDGGWQAFDESATPYTAEELERERERTRDLIPIV